MARTTVPAADALLDQPFQVLDHGKVVLVDYLGSDSRVVQAARVSYQGGTKSFRQDRQLIRYLWRNEHTSPFEQVVLTFYVKCPMFVGEQFLRHRTARVNKVSGRYSLLPSEFYMPDEAQLAPQSNDKKQGRSGKYSHEDALDIRLRMAGGFDADYRRYEKLIEDHNLARELSRAVLPASIYTEFFWQIDLNNLFKFLHSRLDSHAQWEIGQYAKIMASITEKVAPHSYEAFRDFTLESKRVPKSLVLSMTQALEWYLSNRDDLTVEQSEEVHEALKLLKE